ncbi:MAG: B3/B4 domain-containing protein [Pyrinomonadaceae bacterium]
MIYRIEPKIFAQYPAFVRGVVVASHVNNTSAANVELDQLLRQRTKEIEVDPAVSVDHFRIKAWSDVYRTFEFKEARKLHPSIWQLVGRIKKQKTIPFISPLVCISNLISLTHLTPSGLVDASQVVGDLVLGYALGSESFVPIGGGQSCAPWPGEIIYYDSGSGNVMCRAWNNRGGQETAVLATTKTAIIDVDGLLTAIPREEIETATIAAADLVQRFCGASTTVHFLSSTNPTLVW